MRDDRRRFLLLASASAATALTGCGRKDAAREAVRDRTQRVEPEEEIREFYASDPKFFRFATPADLPADLVWTDDADAPEIGDPAAKKGGTFYWYVDDFPRTLRFIGPDASSAFRAYILDYNALKLLEPHPNAPGKYMPLIAKDWAVGKDGRTVFFHIDPAAKFGDGMPVRADDFFYLFYFMRSKYHYDLWYNDYATKEFGNITKYDDLTFSVTLPESKPDLVYRAGDIWPVPLHHYQTLDPDYLREYNWRPEPTPGAYEILPGNLDMGRNILMTKVPGWWGNAKRHYRYRYNVDAINFQVIRDPSKQMEAFRRGDLDLRWLTVPQLWHKQFPDDDPLVTKGYVYKATFYNRIPVPSWALLINSARPLLDNRDIRQGIQFSLNWQSVLKEIFYGDYVRMNTVADGYGAASNETVKARPWDIPKAQECFAKAGFTRRGGDGIFVNDQGQRLSFTLTTGYKRFQDVLTILREQAKPAGLELNVEILEPTAAWTKSAQKKHDIVLTGRNNPVELYPRFWETYAGENAFEKDAAGNLDRTRVKVDTNNETSTADPEIDRLIGQYRKSSDMEEIIRLSRQLIALLHEDAAFVPSWKESFWRIGAWRWLRYPQDGNVMQSRVPDDFHLFWIDQDLKRETLAAKRAGKTFPPEFPVWDQFKTD
ncbi:MAG: extracellular solute-binding protein [Verrucomicrobiota bacterium]